MRLHSIAKLTKRRKRKEEKKKKTKEKNLRIGQFETSYLGNSWCDLL